MYLELPNTPRIIVGVSKQNGKRRLRAAREEKATSVDESLRISKKPFRFKYR